MILSTWAARHNIPTAAVQELRAMLISSVMPDLPSDAKSEAAVQNDVRLEASKKGCVLFRNNVGAGHIAESGSFVRWGLCNDSASLNSRVKSHDLIGVRPVVITNEHIGKTIGQFLSREIKKPDWKYSGTDREKAQLEWAKIINGLGGDAAIVTGTGSI